ncbi:MAG TPA: metal-dependent hydrolase [Polyangiaceae bacterium]|jgi:predicted metal-dependent hydrolase|nr:metal-dependent hydrolase [Polyangiaceae bacterium]
MTNASVEVRDVAFGFEHNVGGLWNARRPELSHMLNAFQLALPYLEPYFIDAIKEASPRLDDPRVKADAAAFCAQEANHARQHKRYSRALCARYPRLAEFEKGIQQSLIQSRQRDPLEWRLAYTAGYEAITAQLSRWMFRHADDFFRDAAGDFGALMMWHAAEEIEHRHVAFDVLRAVDDRYGLRMKGLFAALRKTQVDLIPAVTYMLEVDGYRGRLDSRMRRARIRLRVAGELLSTIVRYLAPGYHPSKDAEPREAIEWRRDYERKGARERSPC